VELGAEGIGATTVTVVVGEVYVPTEGIGMAVIAEAEVTGYA
jgi:hypothetical protein